MKEYIGTKRVKAEPMTRGAYNEYRGWECPADEDPLDEGLLVEYIDGGKANHPHHEGYISWSPKDVFERAYTPFDEAVLVLEATPVEAAEVNVPSTWQSRLRNERAELADRLERLKAYNADPKVRTLPLVEQQALKNQAKAMSDYLTILDARISRL